MQHRMKQCRGWVILYIVALMIVNGCAAGNLGGPKEGEKQVRVSVAPDSVYKDKEFWSDSSLKKDFQRYWEYRFLQKPDESLKMEAPYFQEMVDTSIYKKYCQSMRSDIEGIEVYNRVFESEHLLVLYCRFSYGNPKQTLDILDHWLTLGGKWYHVMRDSIYFPEEAK